MKILLLDLPSHIPTVMPYSLAMMKTVLSSSLDEDIRSIDLNAKFHKEYFSSFYEMKNSGDDFFRTLDKFVNEARHRYTKISRACLESRKPEGYDFLMDSIMSHNPDVVAISMTYNSQVFFAKEIISELIKKGLKVVVGGPADYSVAKGKSLALEDYASFIEYLKKIGAREKPMGETSLDFTDFYKDDYFSKDIIYPVKTSVSCPYRLCTFCTHHENKPYSELDLDFIRKSIEKNDMKKICFIDDGFTEKRLLEISAMLSGKDITWWCQLRPVKSLMPLLPKLYDSGLRAVAWGIESGSKKILDAMKKGTSPDEISEVLEASKRLGILNNTYVMFGFPGEYEPEFIETIEFLKKNKKNIDLVSTSVFGLQQGSRVYAEPEKYGITGISFEKRTMLGEKLLYRKTLGMDDAEIRILKKKYSPVIDSINKIPKVINACKEQALNL